MLKVQLRRQFQHTHVAHVFACPGHHAGKFVIEDEWTGGARNAADFRVAEVRAADAAAFDPVDANVVGA